MTKQKLYHKRCFIFDENNCDCKCDSIPVPSNPCGISCKYCYCTTCIDSQWNIITQKQKEKQLKKSIKKILNEKNINKKSQSNKLGIIFGKEKTKKEGFEGTLPFNSLANAEQVRPACERPDFPQQNRNRMR